MSATTPRNVSQDMVEQCRRAAKWLREEAAHRVPGHPVVSRLEALAFAVEWLINDHGAVSAGCDALDSGLKQTEAGLAALEEDVARLDLLLTRKNEALGVFADPNFWEREDTQFTALAKATEWHWRGAQEYADPAAFARREMEADTPCEEF